MELENIIKRIKTIKKGDKEVCKELKSSNKAILIYGYSDYSKAIFSYLKEQEIDIEAFVVDEHYLDKIYSVVEKPVCCINDFEIKNYNIVVGFGDVEKSRFLIKNKELLKTNFYFLWEPVKCYTWDLKYIKENWCSLNNIYNELADEKSKSTLYELIIAKLNGCCSRELLETADIERHYFNNLMFSPDPRNEIFIDCGAYNGDTIIQFITFTGSKYRKIYAFEPCNEILDNLKENVKSFENIEIINKGVWNKETTLLFENEGETSCVSEENGANKVRVTTIDRTIQADERVTFIKMDIEGSELKALQGAEKTIMRDMPKMAICCYHKKNDIINLFCFVKKCENKKYRYNIYLRHHSNSAYETVLYAVPVKKN